MLTLKDQSIQKEGRDEEAKMTAIKMALKEIHKREDK